MGISCLWPLHVLHLSSVVQIDTTHTQYVYTQTSENKNLKKECLVRNKSVYVGHRFIFIINVFMNGLDYNVCFCSKIQSRKFCVFGINLFPYTSINLLCSFIVTLGMVWMQSVTVSRVNTQGLAYCCIQKLLQYRPWGHRPMGDFQRLCIPRLSRGYCF